MAEDWLSVTVELLGGRGEELWPWPGRVFAVGPSHTFLALAGAINDAFARWDRSHTCMFTLADGRIISDSETGVELSGSSWGGPITPPLDSATAVVAETVEPGAEFQFVFDLGDEWTHRCVVEAEKVDPVQVLGIRPDAPLPYWGWGSVPDQYGRRWAHDDGQGRVPPRPARPHPMFTHRWPAEDDLAPLDARELRAAIATRDAARYLAAVTGRDIDDALQLVAAGIPLALQQRRQDAEPFARTVIDRLRIRGGAGDSVLAEDILAALRGEPLPGRVLPVELDDLATLLEGDWGTSPGAWLDLNTGKVYGADQVDPMMVGDDDAIDVEADPDRWLWLDGTGSRDGWEDMAAFAERTRDDGLRSRLQRAIEGKGAFRRFRDLVHEEELAEQWYLFSGDRSIGRARDVLAAEGIRVG